MVPKRLPHWLVAFALGLVGLLPTHASAQIFTRSTYYPYYTRDFGWSRGAWDRALWDVPVREYRFGPVITSDRTFFRSDLLLGDRVFGGEAFSSRLDRLESEIRATKREIDSTRQAVERQRAASPSLRGPDPSAPALDLFGDKPPFPDKKKPIKAGPTLTTEAPTKAELISQIQQTLKAQEDASKELKNLIPLLTDAIENEPKRHEQVIEELRAIKKALQESTPALKPAPTPATPPPPKPEATKPPPIGTLPAPKPNATPAKPAKPEGKD